MIDLYTLCSDLKNGRSEFRTKANQIIADIFSFLSRPSPKTALLIDGWKTDFQYIYGDIHANLSSNSKLSIEKLLGDYGIPDVNRDARADDLQILFFSVQTYFSILIKYILKNTLQGIRDGSGFSYIEIILGRFAEHFGIENYCCEDWYCWPVFELENGFDAVMDDISLDLEDYSSPVSAGDLRPGHDYDLIKQIYEAVIPKELRHALGEFYTPDWLAESALKTAIGEAGLQDIAAAAVIDPTCGSGTFLCKTIACKRRYGASLTDILQSVYGIDINPLAVLTAKTNYILSVLDLMDGRTSLTIPVFQADIVRLTEQNVLGARPGLQADFINDADPADAIRRRMEADRTAAGLIQKADILIGNPPWVNWEYMPEKYKKDSQHLWLDYKLLHAKGLDLSFSKEDISVLITYIAMDKLLKTGGVIGFVIRQGVFKSAQNGVGFRKFTIRGEVPIKVIRVEDLSKIKAFEGAANSTALFFGKKGEETKYPVPYLFWEKRRDVPKYSFDAYSQLQETMEQVTVEKRYAMPAVKDDISSLWLTAAKDRLSVLKKILGTNNYRARTGVFTGGANAVYWLRINGVSADGISITNVVARAKRKSEQLTCNIEPAYVYPMLRGSTVRRWNAFYDTYLLCPHTEETRIWPVPEEELSRTVPRTFGYLKHFKDDLEGRNGFAGWEKGIQDQAFHAILRIGGYTFSKYKVIWKYIATEFVCAVISTVDDPFLGEKMLLPNEKIMYVSTDSEDEAYYLCGILSSTLVAECVRGYMNPTSISAHVLNKLNIPQFDSGDPVHMEIAGLCKSGHGKEDIAPYIAAIDNLAEKMYHVDQTQGRTL